ncbi:MULTISPECIES: nickel-responsive transcriptional regulator NikR [unclassified Dysgonomonas]|uniref:nickel-responsive transcriptional regulator NikR n=1 Tax=unclassified Dysgonomonas TaxID=2630389 RepID=UPI00068208D6|nr:MULTISPECIES: nickel-responsive transcriptional regulator NikR [unclassified Dysgonomonas]MBD8347631.1 nickel-responsive transcriptional regulator NikR [Dysgonomonas sp. HGC4]MBF0576909.1 nickel-responsive transcriptional regulator NikR [Dysgonomonas sp. GY617]
MKVVRFGVSVEKDVLDLLDNYIISNKFPNRSQAIRHLIKKVEVESQLDSNKIVGGSITLSFDHHRRELLDRITEIQHQFYHVILCSQHIHLDHDTCMEIIALKGNASVLRDLANQLTAVKGIIHGDLSITMV